MKNRICSICKILNPVSGFSKGLHKCKDCENNKRCYICKEVKDKNEFRNDSYRYDNKSNKCKVCERIKDKIRAKKRTSTIEYKEKRRQYEKNRKRNTNRKVRDFFKDCLKRLKRNKTDTTYKTLGFTKQEFENKFPTIPKGFDLDHCIPLSWFIEDTPIYISCHLSNLQILPSSLNSKKKNYYCDLPSDSQYLSNCLKYIKKEYLENLKKDSNFGEGGGSMNTRGGSIGSWEDNINNY